jgi:hypothetical protein
MTKRSSEYFSRKILHTIEMIWMGWDSNNDIVITASQTVFREKNGNLQSKKLMIAICKNIIANNGTFKV